ncbi:MAG: ASCH domain-containing protein [Bacteroidales bacterium]|jgi:hypothetical protein
MKTLTVKQPWASLIVEGIKDIENRTWKTNFRGRVLIHSSARPVSGFYNMALTPYQNAYVHSNNKLDAFKGVNGAIIGSVEIVDCVINHPSIWAEKSEGTFVGHTFVHKEKDKVIWNWVLANPIKFPEPIPAKGKLSFWDYQNILAEPEEKDGELFCHCQLAVKEINQVTGDYRFGYYCRYCGGKWYK